MLGSYFDEKISKKLVEVKVRKNTNWDYRISNVFFVNDELDSAGEDYFQILLNSREFKQFVNENRASLRKEPSKLIDLTNL